MFFEKTLIADCTDERIFSRKERSEHKEALNPLPGRLVAPNPATREKAEAKRRLVTSGFPLLTSKSVRPAQDVVLVGPLIGREAGRNGLVRTGGPDHYLAVI